MTSSAYSSVYGEKDKTQRKYMHKVHISTYKAKSLHFYGTRQCIPGRRLCTFFITMLLKKTHGDYLACCVCNLAGAKCMEPENIKGQVASQSFRRWRLFFHNCIHNLQIISWGSIPEEQGLHTLDGVSN